MEDTLNEIRRASRDMLEAKEVLAAARAELERLIVQARSEGSGLAEIGQAAGVSPQRIYQIVSE